MFDAIHVTSVARELRNRYEPLRAVTLTARLMQKAVFAGRSDEVVFWALVYASYCGNGLNSSTKEQLDAFRNEMLRSAKRPVNARASAATPEVRRRSARR